MSLYGAIQGQLPGKKMVSGTVDPAAATGAINLSSELTSIDQCVVSLREASTAACAGVEVASISGTTVNWTLSEGDGTVSASGFLDFDYFVIGPAPR
jgi:hypothetical protein